MEGNLSTTAAQQSVLGERQDDMHLTPPAFQAPSPNATLKFSLGFTG